MCKQFLLISKDGETKYLQIRLRQRDCDKSIGSMCDRASNTRTAAESLVLFQDIIVFLDLRTQLDLTRSSLQQASHNSCQKWLNLMRT